MKKGKLYILVVLAFVLVLSLTTKNEVQAELLTRDDQSIVEPIKDDITGMVKTMVFAYGGPAYGKGYSSDSSLPDPFKQIHLDLKTGTHDLHAGQSENNGKWYIMYCAGYGMHMNKNYELSNTGSPVSNGKVISDEAKKIIGLVLIYGYDAPNATGSSDYLHNTYGYINGNAPGIWATQVAVWIAAEGKWGTSDQDRIANYLLIDKNEDEYLADKKEPNSKRAITKYNIIKENVNNALKIPSFTSLDENSAQSVELTWNSANSRFEHTFHDDNNMSAAERVAINYSSDNSNLHIDRNGDDVTIWTTEVVGSQNNPVNVTAKKVINDGYGIAGFWQMNSGTQPYTRYVYAPNSPTYSYVKVYTQAFDLTIEKEDQYGQKIPKCTFRVTGENFDRTVTTGDDGTVKLEKIPAGTYHIQEQSVSGTLTLNTTTFDIQLNNNITYTMKNEYSRGELSIEKKLVPPQENGWLGDANCEGIQYTLYAADDIYEGKTLIYKKDEEIHAKAGNKMPKAEGVITFDKNGTKQTVSDLPLGNYYWKETKANNSTEKDNNTYPVSIEKSEDDTAKKAAPTEIKVFKDKVKTYNLEIIKFYDEEKTTTKQPAEGATLKLTLDSDNSQSYTTKVDSNGHAEFKNIAYGHYTLSEPDSGSNKIKEIEDTAINLTETNPNMEFDTVSTSYTTYMIIGDPEFTTYLEIQKIDHDIQKVVGETGTKFKIYSEDNKKFVDLLVDNHWINEFETDSEGKFITPQQLTAGEYRIYETQAPDGYIINPKLALPTDESKIGTEGGLHFTLDKYTNVTILPEDKGTLHTVNLEDQPKVAKLEVIKTGEMVTGVTQTTEEDVNGNTVTVNTPTYEYKGLKGVEFQVITAEDIKTPDGRYTYPGYEKGKVVATITTDENGYAITGELYCGNYILKETKTPYGYIPEPDQLVTLKNETKNEKIELTTKKVKNDKQPVNVSMEKLFDVGNYEVTVDSAKASLGIYTNHDIKDSTGKVIIRKDSLVGLANCELTKEQMEEGEKAKINEIVNIPEGDYYVKEIATTQPFEIDDEEHPFTVKFDDNDDEPYNVTLSDTIVNIYPQVETLRVYKISDSSLINAANGVFTGTSVEDITTLDESELSEADKANKKVIEDKIEKYTKYSSKEEAEEELKKDNINLLAGAQYKVYLDKECTKPLHRTVDGVREEVTLVTNENGYAEMNNVPKGKYYLKEVVAPKYKDSEGKVISYDVAKNPVEIELTDEHVKNRLALRIASDSLGEGDTFKKTDIFTGETIPNCTFEILDENKNVLLHTTTDNNGTGYIPYDILENGKTYYLKEISAPGIYDINEELHDFVASYEVTEDGKVNWTGEKIKVNNRRKEGKLTVIKTDRETGKRLQGCVFSIALLDENGNIAKNAETGEEIYLVKNAVTDENGEYVNENVPYGTYKFIEVTPPEGYEIDNVEDILNATFTIGDDSKEVIFEVTNTGDIAVVALSIVAVVSVAGIVYVALKNKRKNA